MNFKISEETAYVEAKVGDYILQENKYLKHIVEINNKIFLMNSNGQLGSKGYYSVKELFSYFYFVKFKLLKQTRDAEFKVIANLN